MDGMSRTIVYCVSGHGFGHARRTAEVLKALTARDPDVRVVIRTSAPGFLFRDIANVSVWAPERSFDPGVVERDALSVDPRASLVRLDEAIRAKDSIVEAESGFARSQRAALVVADIPFLAGDIARAAGVPCVGLGNFTWDWIYEPYASTKHGHELIEEVRRSHEKFDVLLHLPLGHDVCRFKRVIDVPLIASRPRRSQEEVERRLGLAADRRPRVVVAMRGGLAEELLFSAARQSPDTLFLVPASVTSSPPKNIKPFEANNAELDFTDVLSVCDAVVSKLGYGILADSIACGVALLYPPRQGFREDEISRRQCPRYLRMRELPQEDFVAGHWDEHLRSLLAQPKPPESLATNGAEVVAGRLLEFVQDR
jgi:hypothetical protein